MDDNNLDQALRGLPAEALDRASADRTLAAAERALLESARLSTWRPWLSWDTAIPAVVGLTMLLYLAGSIFQIARLYGSIRSEPEHLSDRVLTPG